MRNKLIQTALAVTLCASAFAQTREVTESGTFDIDAQGRYVRMEGLDGIVVHSLYEGDDPTKQSGHTVEVNGLNLTVRYEDQRAFSVAGLPAVAAVLDRRGRTTAVEADGKVIVVFDYTSSGLVASATVPGRFKWKVAAPNASRRIRQSVEDASGKVLATALAKPVSSPVSGRSWLGAMAEIGISAESLTYDISSTNYLTIARDAKGDVAFYVVHAAACDVGFLPDGTPRFYDLAVRVWSSDSAPGSDLIVSPAFDAQRGTVPDHVIVTAGGMIGLYSEEVAENAISGAWADPKGKIIWSDPR